MPRLDYTQVGLPLNEWTPPETSRRQRLPKLNPDEQAFCEAMVAVQFTNAAAAVRQAFPATRDPRQVAKKLMRKPHVRYAVEVLRNREWERLVGGRQGAVRTTYEEMLQLVQDSATPRYLKDKLAAKMLRTLGLVRQQTQNHDAS